jgi:hypothetical protein
VASGEHLVEQQAETFLFRRAELAGHGRDKATYFRGEYGRKAMPLADVEAAWDLGGSQRVVITPWLRSHQFAKIL